MRRILWPSGSSSDPYSHPPSCLPQAAPGCSCSVVSSVAVVALFSLLLRWHCSLSFFYGTVLSPSFMAQFSLLRLLLSVTAVALISLFTSDDTIKLFTHTILSAPWSVAKTRKGTKRCLVPALLYVQYEAGKEAQAATTHAHRCKSFFFIKRSGYNSFCVESKDVGYAQ